MKRYTSVASLAIRLTWLYVLVYFGTLCACQWVAFLNVNNSANHALEYRLDNWPMGSGRLGMAAMMLMLYSFLKGGKGSQFHITLKRLSVSELKISFVWTLVFAGWFLLYWVVQLLNLFGMYANYVHTYGDSENLLFVVAMRSKYFHYLLPLYEPWGFVRNVVLCFALGSFTALGSMNARNGRWNPLCLFFMVLIPWGIMTPQSVATQGADIAVSVIALICVIWDWIWTWRWMRNENA